MRMLARIFRDLYDPSDYRFGIEPVPSLQLDDYVNPPYLHLNVIRPRRQTSGTSNIADSKKDTNQFKVMLNVKHFRPEEIEVKTVENSIVIHGKHEEHADEHGFVSREFTRRYQLPDDVKPHTVKCSLSQDGVLTISAPRKAIKLNKNERIVPITMAQTVFAEAAQKRQQQLQEQWAAQRQNSKEQK